MPRKATKKSYDKEQIVDAITKTARFLKDPSLILAGAVVLTTLENPTKMDKIFSHK